MFQTSFVPGLRTSCGPNWYTGGSNNNSYILALFVACFVLPLGLILFSYTNLLVTLRAVSAAGPLFTATQDPMFKYWACSSAGVL